MFTKKALLLAAWSAAVMAVPALGFLNPVVRPAIDRVPVKTDTPWHPRNAMRYDDGVTVDGAMVVMQDGRRLMREPGHPLGGNGGYCQPVYEQAPYCRQQAVGWWGRGPIRRGIAGPFRWLFGRRGC